MKKLLCIGICVLLSAAAAYADPITKVVFEVETYGVDSAFTSNHTVNDCGTLNWTNGVVALVYTSASPLPVRLYPVVSAAFTKGTDTSSGNLASAVFEDLAFTVSLYSNSARTEGYYIGSIGGSLYGSFTYTEREIFEGTVLDGSAIIQLTSFDVAGYNWSEGLFQPTGLISQTSLASSIDDYQSNWSSNNTKITILADESGIPEPATIGLLCLGGLLLGRKR